MDDSNDGIFHIKVSIDHAFGLPHLDVNDEEDSQISNNTVSKITCSASRDAQMFYKLIFIFCVVSIYSCNKKQKFRVTGQVVNAQVCSNIYAKFCSVSVYLYLCAVHLLQCRERN
jgi:hypothetical protein